jgi:hypothetical protein
VGKSSAGVFFHLHQKSGANSSTTGKPIDRSTGSSGATGSSDRSTGSSDRSTGSSGATGSSGGI